MIVRNLAEAKEGNRRIVDPAGNWESVRMLLKGDQMGFSFHITTIYKGADFRMHYQNHLESVYCMSGRGEVETIADGKVHPIEPGTIYILDKHDQHILRAFEEMTMACVFNPPLNGTEVHNKDGAYELDAEVIDE
ncbi:ectoine synthase [Teredinibacter sp. KSP-S5-2]|uniref:ectoine synthase n=1 Tax=Teredinibacter sp. KSP-S5-2 TaxID=3034506 RepID=UPI002935299E|nr:ectoine synthase [Teredinibacter sp. KSP-S5-2]WNO11682.1 ectoine synthase [Teredinibacter sp. KSP-S5-2]